MKKTPLLNSHISSLIATLGHTDSVVIADAGLPIPKGVWSIDLALVRGVPSFEELMKALLTEMTVESYIIASEASEQFEVLCQNMLVTNNNKTIGSRISHENFKKQSHHAKAVIRTGECSPYYNIILQAGVSF
ncbi:MAG: D-ribose pyranase [Brevinema sp.]